MGASVGLRELQWRRIGKERQESSLQPCSRGPDWRRLSNMATVSKRCRPEKGFYKIVHPKHE